MMQNKKCVRVLVPKELTYSLEYIYNLKVKDITVCHQCIDDTKWGSGLSITKWLSEIDQIESEKNADIIQKKIMEEVQITAADPWLQQEVYMSKMYYYGYLHTPHNHRYDYARSNITVDDQSLQKKYQVEIRLFPYLIPTQDPEGKEPIWRKGSISIIWKEDGYTNRRWQVIKWC
jgi:hypothetical protein